MLKGPPKRLRPLIHHRADGVGLLPQAVAALFCGLLAPAFWLLVAARFCHAAELPGMSGPLWELNHSVGEGGEKC